MHGQFVWYELMTSSAAGAKAFYPAVAGWATEDWPHSQYTMWTSGGIPLGGIVQLRPDQLQQGMRSAWMPYIEAGDVDETARKAPTFGGRVLFGPQDIPGTGRFAVLADPQGAVFAIYHSLSPSEGFDGDPIPGRFAWHELTTTNHRAALEFYRRLFGWESTGNFTMDVGDYQMYGSRGKSYGGMFTRTPEMGNMPPFWLCYIAVTDLEKSLATAKKLGGKIMTGPVDVPDGGRIAVLTDPQGAMFALFRGAPEGAVPSKRSRATGKSARRPARKPAARKTGAKKKKAAGKSTARRKPAATKRKTSAKKKSARKAPARASRKGGKAKKRR
jgi:predicted enzyme related to lactoylglutathione lyase